MEIYYCLFGTMENDQLQEVGLERDIWLQNAGAEVFQLGLGYGNAITYVVKDEGGGAGPGG